MGLAIAGKAAEVVLDVKEETDHSSSSQSAGASPKPAAQKWASRSYSLCGRCQLGCIELPMIVGEIFGFVGAIYYSYVASDSYGESTAALTSGVPAVACLMAHYLVRKYGNPSLLTEQQTANANSLKSSLAVQISKVEELTKNLQSAQETNAKAGEQITQVEKLNVDLAQKVAASMETVKQFQSENETLQKTLGGLQGDLQRLTQSKGDIAEWTAKYSTQNSALKEELDQLIAAIPSLQNLTVSLAGREKHFDEALQEFAQKIQESQNLSEKIIQNVQAQNQELSKEIETLRETYTQMMEAEQKTRTELDLVGEIAKSQDAQTKALETLEKTIRQQQSSGDSALLELLKTLKESLDSLKSAQISSRNQSGGNS